MTNAWVERGVPETITKEQMENGQKVKKQQKVLKKIPASAIRQAKGIAIYTAFRMLIHLPCQTELTLHYYRHGYRSTRRRRRLWYSVREGCISASLL